MTHEISVTNILQIMSNKVPILSQLLLVKTLEYLGFTSSMNKVMVMKGIYSKIT